MSITSFVTVENPKLYSINSLGKLRTEHKVGSLIRKDIFNDDIKLHF